MPRLFHPVPVGSRRLKNNGHGNTYWMVKTEQPNKWEYEHRVIAASMVGRKLMSDEVVHHINGDTLDNRPSNLAVWTREEHGLHHWYLDNCYFPYGV